MKFIPSLLLVVMTMAFSGFSATAQNTSPTVLADKTETITVKVKGVGCANDLKDIAANVKKLDGVSSCEEGKMGPTSTFIITFNPAVVTEKEIRAAIEDTPGCENPNDRPYKVKG
ncbi:MAG: heavy-metal-associated domain-containing protein [Saprospiraceae bacterium]|nr:heavy-metal-associated domain-containing protein [Saprospiraceae bacterium]